MSVIVAYALENETYIGSDTNSTCDYVSLDTGPKWFGGKSGWWYGTVGSMRVANIVEENIDFLTGAPDMPRSFVPRFIDTLARAGWTPGHEDGRTPKWGYGGILACAGEVYDTDPELSLARIPIGRLCARGSGAHYALGAAFAAPQLPVHLIVKTAIGAAAFYDYSILGSWVHRIKAGAAEISTPVVKKEDFSI